MQFRTYIDTKPAARRLSHRDAVLSIGSCFSKHIAERLGNYCFNVCSNPTGIVYNPLSIAHICSRLCSGKRYTADELFMNESLYRSFDHHTSFNAATAESCLEKINSSFDRACGYMQKLDVLVITFGTAFVYRCAENGRLVNNCHKLPHSRFARSLLSIKEIVDSVSKALNEMRRARQELFVVATVSPVRHLRDDAHENQVSKAHLLSALYELEKSLDFLHYFPSYEILMDELRDYRFYGSDMIHPSSTAADYIWQRFSESCISERSQDFIRDYAPLRSSQNHRIANTEEKASRNFIARQLEKIDLLAKKYPEINVEPARRYFESL